MNKLLLQIKNNGLLIAILVLGSIIRFYHIDFQSVWLDEIHTINEANPDVSLSELYQNIVNGEQMPPLYFYSVYFLFKIFGYTTMVVRMYSAILGIVSLYAIYKLGKEMMNKQIGLISSLLLCLNYFHLYYSQEARPYIFLLLFSILSFYSLVVFVKRPMRNTAILHGIFSALMINAHFFGLFALFAQYLILLFFLIVAERENRKQFFISSIISGVITLVLFLPALNIFLKITEIKEFWIPAPTLDAYTIIFKEFFGNSEFLLSMIGIILLLYFIRLSKEKDFPIRYSTIVENKFIFSFIVLVSWIVIVLLIPIIRSYMSVPMIINRYFIVILPAIILLIAIGICQFKNQIVRITMISLFVIFSMTDIFVIKNYYNNAFKTQYRETTNFIKENKNNKGPVVTALGWYLPYFFRDEKNSREIIEKPLELYITEMMQDQSKVKAFWFLEAQGKKYELPEQMQQFVDTNFYIDNNYDGINIWAKHFVLLKDVPTTIDISKFKDLKDKNGDNFMFNLEVFENINNTINAGGWAFFENQESGKSTVDLVLIKEGKAHRLKTQKIIRNDVTTYFKSDFNLSNSGFSSTLDISKLEPGKYRLGIYMINSDTKKEGLILTDKFVDKAGVK